MLVNFRQGIVSYPVGFLTKVGTPVGSRVALNIQNDKSLTLHFAHRGTNYIVTQKTSVGLPTSGAFGPLLAGVDYWLYADIDLTTGIVSWNNTQLEPVNQATTPTATQTIISDASLTELVVQAGRHWFKTAASGIPADDLAYPATTMFVRNIANTAWEERVRVMLAKYEEATFFVSVSVNASNPNTALKFSGTQAGNLTQNSAGVLIYSSASEAYKNSDGTFVTTEDVLKTGMLLGADMKIGNYVVQGVAQAAFPGYTIVRFSAFGQVTPVTLFNIDQGFFGLVEAAAVIGQQVQVIFEGVVTNSAWTWSQANAPIYVNNSGALTETIPSVNDAEPVAFAISPTQILLRSSRVEVGLVDHATDVLFGAVRLDVFPPTVAGYLDFVFDGVPPTTLILSTGLSITNTYTAQMFIDGVTRNIVYGPSNFPGFPFPTVPTFGNLITFLNTTAPGSGGLLGVAVVSLFSPTALRITSATSGPTSNVRVNSGSAILPNLDLFESLANYATVDTPVDGYYDSVAASFGSLALHIADTTVHLSAEQNSLLDLLDTAAVGIVVKSAEGAMVSRSLVAPAAGITITNGNGVAGNPTLVLANDLAAYEGLATLGVVVRNVANAAVTRTITGTAGNIDVTDGDGVAGDPTVDLAFVVDSNTGTFEKVTVDAWGRVTGTDPVVTADITTLVDAEYVNVVGDTMTGALALAAGSSALPSLTFASDPTKGMYDSGAGEISFAIAGAQKVLIDSTGITTFSGYASTSPGLSLWDTADPFTGISFGPPGVMTIMVAGVPFTTFGGPPGPMTALIASDIGVSVQAWDDDLDAIAGLGMGIVVLDGTGGAFARTITGTAGNITVTDGSGVAGNPTLNLPAVGTPVVASFVKITTDTQGRVSATTPVLAADVTALISATYVDSTGDTMTGALVHPVGSAALPSITFTGDPDTGIYQSVADEVAISIGGIRRFAVSSALGRIDCDLKIAVPPGSAGLPSITFGADLDTGFYNVTANDIGVSTGGVLRFTFASAGHTSTVPLAMSANKITGLASGTVSGDALHFGQIGAQVQAFDATLSGLAALAGPTGLVVETAADTFTNRTITGTASRLTVTDGNGVAANPTLDISATYVGQASITTLGTITTGVWTGTTIAIANGGTGATSASAARTSLGVAIGSDVQAFDSDLAALAATVTTGLYVVTGVGTSATRTITGTASRLTVTDGNGVAANPTLDISATYVGQASITTLGTITTGVWDGTDVAVTAGGTGSSTASGARTNLGAKAFLDTVVTKVFADSPYAVTATDEVVLADATGGAITVNLPTPTTGRRVSVKKTDSSANAVTVDTPGAETIDGAATFSLASQYDAITVVADGTNWSIF